MNDLPIAAALFGHDDLDSLSTAVAQCSAGGSDDIFRTCVVSFNVKLA